MRIGRERETPDRQGGVTQRTPSLRWPIRGLGLVGFLLALCGAGWGATTVAVGTTPGTFVLQGTLVTPEQVVEGKVVVEGDAITCAAPDCAEPPGATRITFTDAYLFPGFIDAHNHVAYNVLPKFNPPKLYQNRGQWQGAKAYTAFKAPYATLKATLFCEMVKYGELKALLSGVTTIQGTAPNQTCYRPLIRNAENQNNLGLPANHIRTFILDITSFKGTLDWTKTQAFVVHLGEGIDEKSRKEFDTLVQKGLLAPQTVIIHGTAFGAPEFDRMGSLGTKLIWSPRSNLVLYGKTTNIPLARQFHIPVSLGVDWNPTGSDTLFDELRVAAQVNADTFANAIPPSEWLPMVTTTPATALALDAHLGRLAPGRKADLVILQRQAPTPTESLLRSHLPDVELVLVGGKPLYGTEAPLDQLRPGQCEQLLVHGAHKRICVRDPQLGVPKSGQTLAEIQTALQAKYPLLAPLVP